MTFTAALLAFLWAQEGAPVQERSEPEAPLAPAEWSDGGWMPGGDPLYGLYLADPVTPRTSVSWQQPLRSHETHITWSFGSIRPLFRRNASSGIEAFDFSIEGGVIGRSTVEGALLDSADYRFGFPFGYRLGRFSGKLHPWHLTSHLGDDRIADGRRAIRYHKEELALAFSYDWPGDLRTYLDVGFGFYIGTPNKRWRAQGGLEWTAGRIWDAGPEAYVAVDVKWRQETDWDTAVSVQAGFWLVENPSEPLHRVRPYVEYYFGHSGQTQFPEEREHYVGVGVAFGL